MSKQSTPITKQTFLHSDKKKEIIEHLKNLIGSVVESSYKSSFSIENNKIMTAFKLIEKSYNKNIEEFTEFVEKYRPIDEKYILLYDEPLLINKLRWAEASMLRDLKLDLNTAAVDFGPQVNNIVGNALKNFISHYEPIVNDKKQPIAVKYHNILELTQKIGSLNLNTPAKSQGCVIS